MGIIMWLFTGLVHIFFVPDFVKLIDSRDNSVCVCDLPEVAELVGEATEEERALYDANRAERDSACLLQCPAVEVVVAPVVHHVDVVVVEDVHSDDVSDVEVEGDGW